MPASTPGITLGTVDRKMGQRGTRTCDVILEDVRVPLDAVIGAVEGQGFKTAMKVLNRGRLHISSVAVGAAERLCDESVAFARDRQQFGKRIADHQLIQAMLADSGAETWAGRCMVLETARRFDEKARIVKEAAACKMFCTEMVGRVADRAVQILAARATCRTARSSISTVTCAFSGCTKARPRSSRSSSPAR
nr:acyl-CoA dehydrogenase [Paracoccus mutanolyticus]